MAPRWRAAAIRSVLAAGLLGSALALAEVGELDPIEIAKARFVAARAVWATGSNRKEALALAEESRLGYEASERPSLKEIAAIKAWIEARR